jgi:DNA-binding NtrC family response regulator
MQVSVMNNTVLLISKDENMTTCISRHITKHHCSVICVENTQEMRDNLKQKLIDAVLVVLKGLENDFIKLFKLVDRFSPFTQIISINNSGRMKLSIKCMKAGVFDDFYPPLDMNHLVRRIKEAAEKKRVSIQQKRKKMNRFDRVMMAISFAESNDEKTARHYLKKAR